MAAICANAPTLKWPVSTYCGRSRSVPWTPQLGGECAYVGRLGKDRIPGESRPSFASAKYASTPKPALRQTLHQRLGLGDLRHLGRRRKAFQGSAEDGARLSGAGRGLVEFR